MNSENAVIQNLLYLVPRARPVGLGFEGFGFSAFSREQFKGGPGKKGCSSPSTKNHRESCKLPRKTAPFPLFSAFFFPGCSHNNTRKAPKWGRKTSGIPGNFTPPTEANSPRTKLTPDPCPLFPAPHIVRT